MSTKIQINSLEALERLIGNDNELEIEVRNNIVQDFAKKHLKSVANSGTIQNAVRFIETTLQAEIKAETERQIGVIKDPHSYNSYNRKVILNDHLDRAVKAKASAEVSTLVEDAVKTATDKIMARYTPEYIDDVITSKLEYYTDKLVEKKLEQRLSDLRKLLK